MRLILVALSVGGIASSPTYAQAETFGGYECTINCSSHKAGYDWAEHYTINNQFDCAAILEKYPNSQSFYEGCLVYVQDPRRGSDEDDDGNPVIAADPDE